MAVSMPWKIDQVRNAYARWMFKKMGRTGRPLFGFSSQTRRSPCRATHAPCAGDHSCDRIEQRKL
jgi:hypothetical protein